jgi:hypothetical protein
LGNVFLFLFLRLRLPFRRKKVLFKREHPVILRAEDESLLAGGLTAGAEIHLFRFKEVNAVEVLQ